jgi:hypothetical protein
MHEFHKKIAESYEALGRHEDALEMYFATWGQLGHYEIVYRQYKQYLAVKPSLRLSAGRLADLAEYLRSLCRNHMYAGCTIRDADVPMLEREIRTLEAELARRGVDVAKFRSA